MRGMARKSKSSAMNVKMYKHFAMITVCLTAAVALFADEEKREVIAEEVRSAEIPDAPKKPPTLIVRKDAGGGAGGDLAGFYGGVGGAGSEAGYSSSITPAGLSDNSTLNSQAGRNELAKLGISREEFDRMSPEEKAAILAAIRAGGMQNTETAKRAMSASAIRAGGSGEMLDYTP